MGRGTVRPLTCALVAMAAGNDRAISSTGSPRRMVSIGHRLRVGLASAMIVLEEEMKERTERVALSLAPKSFHGDADIRGRGAATCLTTLVRFWVY